jgi:uncharacterized repeat protein (TIGR03803 family)
LLRDAAGNLYGTTYYGGSKACQDGCGKIFKLIAIGKDPVLYRFGGQPDGENPDAGLIRDGAGNLYGTTNIGAAFRGGTVFKLDTTGKETVLHSFSAEPDGSYPVASLVRDAKGDLYGTTLFGGDATCDSPIGCGTVFRVDTSGHETVLHAFAGGADGELPAHLWFGTQRGICTARRTAAALTPWELSSSWIVPARKLCCTASRAEPPMVAILLVAW